MIAVRFPGFPVRATGGTPPAPRHTPRSEAGSGARMNHASAPRARLSVALRAYAAPCKARAEYAGI